MAAFVTFRNKTYLYWKTYGLKHVELFDAKGRRVLAPNEEISVVNLKDVNANYQILIRRFGLQDSVVPQFVLNERDREEVLAVEQRSKLRKAARPRGNSRLRKSIKNRQGIDFDTSIWDEFPEFKIEMMKELFPKSLAYYQRLEEKRAAWKPKPKNDRTIKVQSRKKGK